MRLVPDAPKLRLVPETSPYSPSPEQRQAATDTAAKIRQFRDEQAAQDAQPKYRIGLQLPFMDEPLVSAPIPAELAAFGAEAAKSVLPTGAGIAGASAITPYSTAAANVLQAAPGLGRLAAPLVRYGAPLLAGGVAAMGARLAEEEVLPAILPDASARSYELTQQLAAESPTAAMLGQFAGAGPFLRPGLPINTTGGARVAVPLIAGGIGGGIEGAQQIAEGDFDPQRLALATAGSALLNRETRLGQRVGPNLVMPNLGSAGPELPAVSDDALLASLTERLAGKTPEQQLAVVKQETALNADLLTPNQERAALDIQQGLEAKIAEKNALEDGIAAQEKAVADQQKAMAEQQKAIEAAQQPPEIPKSEQILAEPTSKPPSIANVATEVATQTKDSPYALQERLNQMTAPVAAQAAAGTPPSVASLNAADFRNWAVQQEGGITTSAYNAGLEAIGNKAKIDELKASRAAAQAEANAANARIKQGDESAFDDASSLATKVQYFREAIEAAEGKGSAMNEPRVRAAHEPQPTLDNVSPPQPAPANQAAARQAPQETVALPRTAEQRLNDAGADLPPISSLKAADKLAELQAGGIKTYNGKPIEDANPAQLSNALGKMRRGQLERGSISSSVIAPLGGSAAGATGGYLATDRRDGETEEEFQARRLRATIGGAVLGAGSGILAGGAMSRGVKARAAAKPRVAGAAVDLPEVGADQGIRQTAEKVIENPSYPQQLRQTLADDPAIIYDKISRNQYRDTVASASDAEIQQMLTSSDQLLRLAAQAEYGSRLSVTPGMEQEGARVISEFAKNFTSPAQILGLAGLIRSPQAMVKAVEDTLRLSVGRGKPLPQMTPAVRKKLFALSSENIKAETRFAKAEKAARKDFNPDTRAEFMSARDALGVSKKQLADYTKDILPERYGQIVSKIIKGNLLAPLSFAKNMFGNAAWQTLLRGSESVATLYDAIYSGAAGKPRIMGLGNPLPGKEELQALGDGIRIAGKEMLTGPSSESYIKAEVQRGFHPLRAMLQTLSGVPAAERAMERTGIASLPRTPTGGVRINDRAKKLIEATLGIAPEAAFRFLNFGDKPVRYAVQQRILSEQANLRGLKGAEREKFMLLPDPDTQALMEAESMGGILAQENKAALKVGKFMDEGMVDIAEAMGQGRPAWLEDINKIVGTLVIPYRQFPANFAITAANFALPPVGIARAWAQAAKGNQREALRNMGEATIGFMLLGAAGYLWDKGLISEPADPKDKKRRSAQYETMGAQRLNISGLERLRSGGDPTYKRGDHTVDWSSMGPAAASFYALTKMKSSDVNKASRTGEIPKERGDFEAFLNVMDVAGFAFDQSFLSGTSAALDAFKDWENYGDRFLQNTFRAITSIPAPNSLEAFNRTQYKFIPEQKGDTTTETLKNVWDYKTGQLDQSERQNYKRDFWGNPITRTAEGQNPVFAQFFDVTKGERKAPDPFKQSLLELYQQTRSTDVYPPLVTRYMSNNGVTVELDADDYDRLQDLTGQVRETLGRQVASDPRFASPDIIPEAKIEYLNRVYSAGAKAGKAQLFQMPGFTDKYPELFGQAPKPGHKSRVVSRDTQARGRLRLKRDASP